MPSAQCLAMIPCPVKLRPLPSPQRHLAQHQTCPSCPSCPPAPQDGRPPKHAVRGLSLLLPPRQVLGLLGPNGAGKSSALRVMQGQAGAGGGAVLVAGRHLAGDPVAAQQLVGVCPQHDVLWDSLTAREHLLLYCRWGRGQLPAPVLQLGQSKLVLCTVEPAYLAAWLPTA